MPWAAVRNEALVLGVFALGLGVARRAGRRWTGPEIGVMYIMGLLFELLTAHMWRYHDILLVLPGPIDDDVSVLFPLGWAGWIMTTTGLAEQAWRRWRLRAWWSRHLALMGIWLVVGDLAETLFYRIGMIEYVEDASTRVNFLLGQVAGLPPTVVLIGYIGIPPLACQFMRALKRSLAPPAPGVRR